MSSTLARLVPVFAAATLAFILTAGPPAASAGPPADFNRTSAITLEAGEFNAFDVALDRKRGYVYVSVVPTPTRIVKFRAATESQPAARIGHLDLNPGEFSAGIQALALDEEAGMLYVVTSGGSGAVVKVSVGDGDSLPVRVGAFQSDGADGVPTSIAIDPGTGYGYVGTAVVDPGRVLKFRLGEGSQPPVRIGSTPLNPGQTSVNGIALDPGAGKVYAVASVGDFVAQFSAGAGDALPAFEGDVSLTNVDGTSPGRPLLDRLNRILYVANASQPGLIAVDVSGAQPRVMGAPIFRTTISNAYGLASDPANGFLFVAHANGNPADIVKAALGGPDTLPGATAIQSGIAGENSFTGCVYDAHTGFLHAIVAAANPSILTVFRQPFNSADPRLVSLVTSTKVSSKGGNFTAQAKGTVTNDSALALADFRIRAFLSSDDVLSHDDIRIGKDILVKTLKAGKARKFGFKSAPQPGTATGKRIIVVADALKQVDVQNRATTIAVSEPLP